MTLRIWLEKVRMIIEQEGSFALFKFTVNKLVGVSKFVTFSSTMNFKSSQIQIAEDTRVFLYGIFRKFDSDTFSKLESEFSQIPELEPLNHLDSFPKEWNSGRILQFITYAVIRYARPEFVVEIGTGNGYLTRVISMALKKNGKGILHSLDLVARSSEMLSEDLASIVQFHQLPDSSLLSKRKLISGLIGRKQSLNLLIHDGDHSYFGQYGDYKIAKDLEFNFLISDDVDSSMAFVEFAKELSGETMVMLDKDRLIGVKVLC